MSGDLSLFGDDDHQETAIPPAREAPITDWQVDLLRKALDARNLTTMDQRQKAIEDAAGRSVESLRSLTQTEALRTLTRLGPAPEASSQKASAWDERDGDTWIDRL